MIDMPTDTKRSIPHGIGQALLQCEHLLRQLFIDVKVRRMNIATDQLFDARIVSRSATIKSFRVIEPEVIDFQEIEGGCVLLPSGFDDFRSTLICAETHITMYLGGKSA